MYAPPFLEELAVMEEHQELRDHADKEGLAEVEEHSGRISVQTEDEPIGWFELEEDWNDVEIKLQQCRVAKFLMVKFLCTRQDSAERLGVQNLSFSGYLCPGTERLVDLDDLSGPGESLDHNGVTGLCLLTKTLFFIQQLTRDMDAPHFRQKYLLDFSGLSLSLFWSFYNKLREIEEEEVLKSRVLLLQLMQNCFPMLPNPVEPQDTEDSKGPEEGASAAAGPSTVRSEDPQSLSAKAVLDLYTHLCHIVDGPEGETVMEAILHKEAVKAILNGAAVFFPDKLNRRDKLFHMMKNITEDDQPESVKVTFESLCNYFSNQDPSGLLLLPPKGAPSDFNISPILLVMETLLLLVASRECEAMMADGRTGASRTVLLSLFWALQGSLLSWCHLQLKGGTSTPAASQLEDQESAHQPQKPVVLRTWNMESPHNYENSRHETTVFACPGATSFEVEFDERCETEKRSLMHSNTS
ncbi:zinc finger ZZ-type and EF-hand domain-containing protein 1-like [Fundulus diaphanus]